MSVAAEVGAAWRAVGAAVAAAAAAAGRAPGEVTVVAVSKRQPLARVEAAYDAGARDFGENTVQGLQARVAALVRGGRADARWHLVGSLQRNKAALALATGALIHSVDRPELVLALARAAAARMAAAPGQPAPPAQPVLVQVNVGREPQKGGVAPEAALHLAQAVAAEPHLRLAGLMALPPADAPPQPYFAALAQLHRALLARPWGRAARTLSMGMSADFSAAIASGATMVRIGQGIFGPRPAAPGEA